jgi:hypothetical protein
MPAKSAKQKKLMDAAAHSPAFAKKVGIPSKVAKKFSRTSKGMEFKKGGSVNRVGRGVASSRRDPDIGKMITEVKPQKSMHTMENGPLMSKSKGAQYACGGEVVVKGTGAARTQKARIC